MLGAPKKSPSHKSCFPVGLAEARILFALSRVRVDGLLLVVERLAGRRRRACGDACRLERADVVADGCARAALLEDELLDLLGAQNRVRAIIARRLGLVDERKQLGVAGVTRVGARLTVRVRNR